MTSREIWHEIIVNAAPSHLYRALTDIEKLAHWWTTDTRGESKIGKSLEFRFGGLCQVMNVTVLEPEERVRWHVTEIGLPDWADTEIEFRLSREGDRTLLHFRHSKWRVNATMFPHCSMGWATYLLSLKEFVETGKGRPYPYDLPVTMWCPPNGAGSREAAAAAG